MAEKLCPVRVRWDPVNEAIRGALSAITLADMEASLPIAWRLPAATVAVATSAATAE